MQSRAQLAFQFRCRLSCSRSSNRLAELLTVGRNYQGALFTARRCDIEQLLLHPIGRDDNRIDRLALATMGSYCVTMCKLPEIGRQDTAILKMDPPVLVHSPDGDNFSVGRTEAALAPIASKQQLVAGSYLDGAPFVDIETLDLFAGDDPQFSILITNECSHSIDAHDLGGFVPCYAFHGAVKSQELAGLEIPYLALLRCRPVERHVSGKLATSPKFLCCFSGRANCLSNPIDLLMCCTHYKRMSSLRSEFSKGLCDCLRAFHPGDLAHRSDAIQPFEAERWISTQFLNSLTVGLFGLPSHLGQGHGLQPGL